LGFFALIFVGGEPVFRTERKMTLEDLLKQKQKILEIALKHGASNVRVFGSVVRGEAGPASDVDVLIDLEPERSLFGHAALVVELEQLLGCRVDVVTERGLRDRVKNRILKEAVPL